MTYRSAAAAIRRLAYLRRQATSLRGRTLAIERQPEPVCSKCGADHRSRERVDSKRAPDGWRWRCAACRSTWPLIEVDTMSAPGRGTHLAGKQRTEDSLGEAARISRCLDVLSEPEQFAIARALAGLEPNREIEVAVRAQWPGVAPQGHSFDLWLGAAVWKLKHELHKARLIDEGPRRRRGHG